VDRSHTVIVLSGEDTKEAIDDSGCPLVYTIFQLGKHSSPGLIADLTGSDALVVARE
jgi:hypothetical protein